MFFGVQREHRPQPFLLLENVKPQTAFEIRLLVGLIFLPFQFLHLYKHFLKAKGSNADCKNEGAGFVTNLLPLNLNASLL